MGKEGEYFSVVDVLGCISVACGGALSSILRIETEISTAYGTSTGTKKVIGANSHLQDPSK